MTSTAAGTRVPPRGRRAAAHGSGGPHRARRGRGGGRGGGRGAAPRASSAGQKVREVAREGMAKAGFAEGKKVVFGVLTTDVEDVPDEATRAARREEAARALTNIDEEERGRRRVVGNVMLAASAVIAAALYAKGVGGFARFITVFFPFNLGLGYYKSAQSGL